MSQEEMKQKGIQAANALTNFVNGAGMTQKKVFVDQMMIEHRTLQQESFDLFLETIEAWAKLPEERVDPRNSATVRLSKNIMDKVINAPHDYPFSQVKFDLDTELKIGTRFYTVGANFEITRVDLVQIKEIDGEQKIVVEGRAKRIYD